MLYIAILAFDTSANCVVCWLTRRHHVCHDQRWLAGVDCRSNCQKGVLQGRQKRDCTLTGVHGRGKWKIRSPTPMQELELR